MQTAKNCSHLQTRPPTARTPHGQNRQKTGQTCASLCKKNSIREKTPQRRTGYRKICLSLEGEKEMPRQDARCPRPRALLAKQRILLTLKHINYVQLIWKHLSPDELRRVARQRHRGSHRRIPLWHQHRRGLRAGRTGTPPPGTVVAHLLATGAGRGGVSLGHIRGQVHRLPHRLHRVEPQPEHQGLRRTAQGLPEYAITVAADARRPARPSPAW